MKTLPGVRESIEQKDWKLAEEQIVRVGKVLENTGEAIQGATAELTRAAAGQQTDEGHRLSRTGCR